MQDGSYSFGSFWEPKPTEPIIVKGIGALLYPVRSQGPIYQNSVTWGPGGYLYPYKQNIWSGAEKLLVLSHFQNFFTK